MVFLFFLLNELGVLKNLRFFLEKLSNEKKNKIKINKNNDKKFAVFKSSNINHELYIPVVKVEIPKYETVPKSDNVSIATNDKPIKIAGLAVGRIILKSVSKPLKPKLLPTSNKFLDWFKNEDLANIKT